MRALKQLVHFGWEQALSCLFPVVIFASLAFTKIMPLPFLPRYDWLLIICLLMQWWMVRSGLETRDELKVITLFHLIGLALEIFKVHMGSWSYPEEGYFKIFGVPLYSGFMYASVASYLCQAWRRLKVELVKWPPFLVVVLLAAAIYLNFFTHHYWIDVRWWLSGLVIIVFWQSWVTYEVDGTRYRMPLTLSFVLIGFFIWIAVRMGFCVFEVIKLNNFIVILHHIYGKRISKKLFTKIKYNTIIIHVFLISILIKRV
ncbi:DUF817 domain-containing protein [Bacillus smithii]|uniref:DUF817 domain-containing protein n=1 Tax=Bacillus smithii 7_3_47FAA TaxID=665952 RepID=G9QNC7_9BACI|nr:DUF817 domain-containing protein [Bacillus smithii]EHL76269.1 hypothetical protein HMPREF1015_03283 [Bacillus smithii 7_3_47FAA]